MPTGPLLPAFKRLSRFHEEDDANLFASWGVDYLKYDNCFAAAIDVKQRYIAMRDALNKTDQAIYFSMCEWGVAAPWHWASQVGNSWRTDQDIEPTWDSILRCLDNGAAGLAQFAGPGGWNDPDMLEVGNGILTPAQQRAHFALWAVVKAPLLIGANLATISNTSLMILKSPEVIAINQDKLGVPGDIIWKEGPLEIWAAPLEGDARAVVMFNRHHSGLPTDITVTWSQLGYEPGTKAVVRNLYAQLDFGVFKDAYTASVGNYDVAVLKISPDVQPSTRRATVQRWWNNISTYGWNALKQFACRLASVSSLVSASLPCKDESENVVALETTWRPWHHPTAAKLQEQLREAGMHARLQRLRNGRNMRRQRKADMHDWSML